MTFLNLRSVLPPREEWKVLNSKIQLRLHKIARKATKKLSWLSIQPKKFKHTKPATLGYQCHNLYQLQQSTTPVYVDKLFIKPVSVVIEHEVDESSENQKCSSNSSEKSGVSDYNQKSNYLPEEGMHVADDMWESLVLASPQMEGINERAEEFIAKFRADMQQQEILARRL